jgi:hypothetical protein
MRQAIITKYLGPTNSRGARVKATAQVGSVTVGWDYALNAEQNHERAMEALAAKFDWPMSRFAGGATPDGRGYAFVDVTGQTRGVK